MLLFSTICLLILINVNCNPWDEYHSEPDDQFPSISWRDCGISSRKSEPYLVPKVFPRIQGGEDARSGEFPWFASIKSALDMTRQMTCGGSILNEWWVLTAAHCVYKMEKYVSAVQIGVVGDNTTEGRRIPIERVVVHHKFISYDNMERERIRKRERLKKEIIEWEITDGPLNEEFERKLEELNQINTTIYVSMEQWHHDLALLKLKERIVPVFNETHYIINSICLPKTGIFNTQNESMVIAGWGLTSLKGSFSSKLMKGVVFLLDNKTCWNPIHSNLPNPFICFQPKIMSVPLFNMTSSCNGDSGSPSHQYYGERWQAIQIGLSSYTQDEEGSNICGKRRGVYQRVSLHMPWIRSHISGTDVRVVAQTKHLLVATLITSVIIAVIICLALNSISVTILRARPRNG